MHLIIICIDSLRQDHVSFYAGAHAPVQTPHIDALAREAVVFENMYPEALPTIPIRTQLMTGQRTLGVRPWQPLHPADRTIAQLLGPAGYTSALITDTYHYFKPDYNFHRAFDVWRWIRGQEYDPYRSQPLTRYNLDDHLKAGFPPQWNALVRRCLQNVEPFQSADDHYCAQLVREALEWLEDNHSHERIFLWDEPDELYHLAHDPKEAHNLIDEYPDVAQDLTRRFGSFYMPGRQPAVKGVQGRYEVAGTGL